MDPHLCGLMDSILHGKRGQVSRSLAFCARKVGQRSAVLRMIDERGKPFAFCLFPFCADDQPGGHSLIPGSLGTEEFPSGLFCAKLLLLFASEPGALSLFVSVDARLFCATCGESLEAGRMHQTHFLELPDAFDVN